jgi:hypothetical protein
VYSLIRPPRTGLRWIRAVSRSVTVARGCHNPRRGHAERCPGAGSSRLIARLRALLHGPLAGRVRGHTAEVHPTCAVLDEHQGVDASAARCPHAGSRPRGSRLPGPEGTAPGRTRAARCRGDARSAENLPHGGRRGHSAGQLPPIEYSSGTGSVTGPASHVGGLIWPYNVAQQRKTTRASESHPGRPVTKCPGWEAAPVLGAP